MAKSVSDGDIIFGPSPFSSACKVQVNLIAKREDGKLDFSGLVPRLNGTEVIVWTVESSGWRIKHSNVQ